MSEPAPDQRPISLPNRGSRSWLLVGTLILLAAIFAARSFAPDDEYDGWTRAPLDRCLTEKAVSDFLDGKSILCFDTGPDADPGGRTITIRKDAITSLSIRAGDPPGVKVRFTLAAEGKSYPVEGEFIFMTHDSPELHMHSWTGFMGKAVANQ